MQIFVCCELLFTLVFIVCLYVLQIDKLWDEKYLDSVALDWQRSPLVEVKEVAGSEACPTGFEEIGQAYFWGMSAACVCTTGGTKKPPTLGKCDALDEQAD